MSNRKMKIQIFNDEGAMLRELKISGDPSEIAMLVSAAERGNPIRSYRAIDPESLALPRGAIGEG